MLPTMKIGDHAITRLIAEYALEAIRQIEGI